MNCRECSSEIDKGEYYTSLGCCGQPLCNRCMKEVLLKTNKAQRQLFSSLKKRHIYGVLEYYDGHKHVDLGILPARLYIEIDEPHHICDSLQLFRDTQRDTYSYRDGYQTIRIPRSLVEQDVESVASSIRDLILQIFFKEKQSLDC